MPFPDLPNAAPPSGEIRALTSLRGLAAMAVVMQHFSATAQIHAAATIPSLVPHGYLGVDLFFALSGFIMAYTYLAAFQAGTPGQYGSFLSRRVARIVPLNVAVLLLFVVAGWISTAALGRNIIHPSQDLARDLPANLLMLQGLGVGLNINGPSWSISTEFAAYFAFPLFIWSLGSRRLAVFIPGLLACLAALVALAATRDRLGLGIEGMPLSLVRCAAGFGLGIGAYRLTRSGWAVGKLGHDGAALGIATGCALFMVARLDLPAVLLFPLLIASLALNRGRVAKLLGSPVLYFFGVISFSIYLLHQLFRPVALLLLQTLHPAPLGTGAALTFALAASFAVVPFAWLAYVLIERPGRQTLTSMFRGAPHRWRSL